jgi:hypothetical protein
MQRFYKPLNTADALKQQREQMALSAASTAAAAAHARTAALLRPGPGRPRKQQDANAVLAAAAAAAAATTKECEEQPAKRGKYCNWSVPRMHCCCTVQLSSSRVLSCCVRFASPYIHDILAAYQLKGHSAKQAVAYLQRSFPQLPTETAPRFAELSESTVRSWHDDDGKLLPKFVAIVEQGKIIAARGPGPSGALLQHADIEVEVKRILGLMRDRGAVVNVRIIQLVMRLTIEKKEPALLEMLTLSKSFISKWARTALSYTWRVRTTAASKLPLDWRQQGVLMAKRIGFFMQVYKVHPSLVVNMDQTGVHLAPVDNRTYASRGAKEVSLIAADDKRQITACIASSLDGDLLPPQLIFQGKTVACHPPLTDASKAAHAHITHSANHWSNQETMRQYISEVLIPYSERRILEHNLPADSHIVLVLDVWAVHKSEEFRLFLRTQHPRIHVVFVPPNCTSQLQVADVLLQRPFKHGIRQRFNTWAATVLKDQIDRNEIVGLTSFLRMGIIKPLVLEWVLGSWSKLQAGRDFIKVGWHTCCVSLFNVHDNLKRLQVVEEVAKDELDRAFVPEESEPDGDGYHSSSSEDEDEKKDELDVMKERQYGTRKSTRKRAAAQNLGYMLNSQQIALTEDSDN